MTDEIRSFRDLIVWQRAIQLAREVYELTKSFPNEERFGLTSQVRRAAISVSSNIAEGHARQGNEFAYFLSVARGSLAEVESQLLVAVALGFLEGAKIEHVVDTIIEIRKMAASLTAKLR